MRIVVVDNNSEDDSVIRIRDKFDDIIIIESKTNLGFSGGNNLDMVEKVRPAMKSQP